MADILSRKILLCMTEEEYQRVMWMSEKLEINNVSKTLRKLIPNVEPSNRRVLSQKEVSEATSYDFIKVSKSFDSKQLDTLIEKIEAKGTAITLARELREQLINQKKSNLTVQSLKRLSRWCHPNRQTGRELKISPIAKEISKLLFGKVIERID